jgi:hypothetical protein
MQQPPLERYRNHLELNKILIIDINGIIRLAEHKFKNS